MQCFGSFSALTCMTRQYSLPARPALVQLRSQALAQCGPSVLVVSVAGVADRHPAGKAGKELCLLQNRSEEHTSELQSLMRLSYAVFCLKKKRAQPNAKHTRQNN